MLRDRVKHIARTAGDTRSWDQIDNDTAPDLTPRWIASSLVDAVLLLLHCPNFCAQRKDQPLRVDIVDMVKGFRGSLSECCVMIVVDLASGISLELLYPVYPCPGLTPMALIA